MSYTNNRVIAGITVAAISLTLAGTATALAGPDQQEARAGALSKAEKKAVQKIATKVARQQVRRLAPTLDVRSAKTAGTATTATTAGTATNAAHATSADVATTAQNAANAAKVGGLDVKRINAVVAPDGPAVTLISGNGFTLRATCAAGVPNVTAASTAPGRLRATVIDNNEAVFTFGGNNLVDLGTYSVLPAGANIGMLSAEFGANDGPAVSVWLGFRNDGPGCAYFGNHMIG